MTKSKEKGIIQYLSAEVAGGARWDKEGETIVFEYNAPGSMQVYKTKITKNEACWPDRLTFSEDRCTDARHLSDGTIVYTTDKGGDENWQIEVIKDSEITTLTTDPKAKHIITQVSENYLYYRANIEDRARFDIYRLKIPVLDAEPEKLFQPEEGIFTLGPLYENEKYASMIQVHGNMHQEIWLLDLETKEGRPLTLELSKGQKYRWTVVRWIDEETLLIVTDLESDKTFLGYLTINQEFNKLILPNNEKYELSDTTWNWKTDYTYFAYNLEGYSTLFRAKFEKEGAGEIEEIKLPADGVIISGDNRTFMSGLSLSPEGDKLAITLSSSFSPTNIWILDLEDKQSWKATSVSTGGIDPSSFTNSSLHRFESFDGLKVPYFRLIPKGEKPTNGWPTIMIIHGGPESQSRPAFSPEMQFYLSSGFGVIVPNIRGSAGYGRKYLDLDNIEKRLDSILDIKHLALHLKENDLEINGEKLIIYGGSYGGFAVLSAMTEHPELWKAGVDIVGISNFVTFLQNTAPWRRKLREAEYGSLEDDMETLIKISPIHNVDKITAPLFIIQGDNDERVPLSESIQMYEILKKKGIPVKLLRYDDEGHGLAKRKNKIDAYSQVVAWLKEIVDQ